jgi:hypothetical protein
MLLVFIDETTDQKFKTCWDPAVEFKGSYLFSATSGCTDVEVVKRIEAAGALLDLNTSKSNSRMRLSIYTHESLRKGAA